MKLIEEIERAREYRRALVNYAYYKKLSDPEQWRLRQWVDEVQVVAAEIAQLEDTLLREAVVVM